MPQPQPEVQPASPSPPVAPAPPSPNLTLLLALLLLGALAWLARHLTTWGAPTVHARVSLDPGELSTSFDAAPDLRLVG